MIEVSHLSLSYGKKQILNNVSFTCCRGQLTSIIGRNGAGKTAAVRCLAGINPYYGQILLDKIELRKYSIPERAKRISYLPQTLPDSPFTVFELASLGRRPYQMRTGKLTEEDIQNIERALEITDMHSFSMRRVNTLSGGEKQRAYLSMVFAQNTDVIVLDEPAAYMDISVEREMYALLGKLAREMNKTIISVMHNISYAVNNADSIVLFENGCVSAQMKRDEAINNHLIEEIFKVKKSVVSSKDEKETIIYL